jgi:hypothetical protein
MSGRADLRRDLGFADREQMGRVQFRHIHHRPGQHLLMPAAFQPGTYVSWMISTHVRVRRSTGAVALPLFFCHNQCFASIKPLRRLGAAFSYKLAHVNRRGVHPRLQRPRADLLRALGMLMITATGFSPGRAIARLPFRILDPARPRQVAPISPSISARSTSGSPAASPTG